MITNAKVPDDFDLQDSRRDGEGQGRHRGRRSPRCAEFSPAFAYKKYGVPYHPGALKFYKERNLSPRPLE